MRQVIPLSPWLFIEVQEGEEPATRHFAGFNQATGKGEVTPPILLFDATRFRGIVSGGAVYELGRALNGDIPSLVSMHIALGRWRAERGLASRAIHDISQQVVDAMEKRT